MSEASEVLLTTEYLNGKLENNVITNWKFLNIKGNVKSKTVFNKFKKGFPYIVESVKCKGKLIYFTLFNEGGYVYILHNLKMTGVWREFDDDLSRWYIETELGEKIWFSNVRTYSNIEFTDNEEYLSKELDKLGIDILTSEFTMKRWNEIIKKNEKLNVTTFLMNQNIISGVGNHMKSEALYYSKISPFRIMGNLTENEVSKLYEGIKIIPRISYNKRGMFGDEKEEDYKIYGKTSAKKSKTLDGYTTYWDPNVQK